MHVIQYIATQADSVDEAHSRVKHHLEVELGDGENYNNWFDWFVTGGGRWASDDNAQYDDNYTKDVVHQSDPKFEEYLDIAHKYRLESLNEYIEQARTVNLTELLDNLGDFEFDHFRTGAELYPVNQIYQMSMGMWNYNSYFFDIENDSTNRKYMRESIDNGDKNWYLVPVDFHF